MSSAEKQIDWMPHLPLLMAILCLFFCVVAWPRSLHACSVCIELPEASVADHILSADFIVLARPQPDNPFKFAPIQVWKENDREIGRLPEIPFLIDSVTRRALQSDPDKTVLFTYGSIDRDSAGRAISRRWTRIFLMTPERAEFVNRLREAAAFWPSTISVKQERIAFLANYLSHPDPILRNVALIEIHRAPYQLVHPLKTSVQTSQLLEEFGRIDRVSYIPVSIRLLGLQTDEKAAAVVRSNFAEVLRSKRSNVYEWALAGIEVDGMKAIRAIGEALGQFHVHHASIKELVRALADGGTVHPEYRPYIIGLYSEAMTNNASLAARIATTMQNWHSKALNHQFESLLQGDEIDPATRFVLAAIVDAKFKD